MDSKESFRNSIIVQKTKSGQIVISRGLREILIKLMQGEISKNEAMSQSGIKDKTTIERKIQELVAGEPNLEELYREYISRKSHNFNGYNFRAEAIEMLRQDLSQSQMAVLLNGIISRRAFSTKMKNLEEENKDNILGMLLREHASRKMRRQKISPDRLIEINIQLDEYEMEFPLSNVVYENVSRTERRLEICKRIIESVNSLLADGFTIKEIARRGIISESQYRKYKKEMENLERIVEESGTDTLPQGDNR